MRKILIFNAFLLATISIHLWVVLLTIKSHRATIDRIAPSTEELREKAEKMGSLRLKEKEVKEICIQLDQELIHLGTLKRTFTFSIILILAFTILGLYKLNLNVTRFDGLSLFVFTLLLYGFYSFIYEFSGGFYGGHNASMDIRIGILIGTFIIPPILFYTVYRMNIIELSHNLHQQKWISYLAISFTIISLLLALIIGMGILFTPDLSGNIT